MKFKNILLIAIFLLINPLVIADELKTGHVEKVDLSFEQAYELMLANNNSMKALLEEIQEKQYQKKAAVGAFFPKVGVNSTYFRFDDPISVGMGHLGSIQLQDQNLWMTSAGASWNIFTGGKILALNAAARAKLEGTNEKYRALTNELIAELVKRYFGLRMAKDVVVVRKQVYDTTKKHLEDALKLEEAGVIAKSERLHADVACAQAQRDYEASVRDMNIIEEGLKTLIKADNVELKDVEIFPSSPLFVYNEKIAKLDEFKQIALQNNPNLKQMAVKKKLAQARYRGEVANYSPTVSLFAYDVLASKDLSYQVPHWTVGASVNMLLFDGFSRYNNLKAADSFRKQVAFEEKDAQNNISSLVTKQYEELMKYKEQFESTNKSIESAQESLRTSIIAFQEGFGTSLAVTDAQAAFSGVKIARLNAIYNYDTTLTDLLRTNGKAEDILNYIKNSTKEKL